MSSVSIGVTIGWRVEANKVHAPYGSALKEGVGLIKATAQEKQER